MTRTSIWIGIGVFILAMLVSVDPSSRNVASLSEISFTGSPALAKKGKRPRPNLPSIFDTIEDLDLDIDDLGPDDDDDDDGPDDDGDE
jgi:hypothetical protein